MTVGFLLTAVGQSKSLAQSAPAPEKPMREDVLKILCQRFPLNSRCQGSADSTQAAPTTPAAPEPTAPAGGGSAPAPDTKSETPAPKEKSDAMPPAAAPTEPTGGGTLPAPGATEPTKTDEATPKMEMPKTEDPAKPEGDMKPKEPTK